MPTALVQNLFAAGSEAEKQGRYAEAREHLAAARELEPDIAAPVDAVLARMLWTERKWAEALDTADRALARDARNFLALIIRSRCSAAMARMKEACEANRRAMNVTPHPEFHSQLLFELNFLIETTPESLAMEAQRWNALYAAPLAERIHAHANAPDPARPLKIGYVSSNLHQHAIMNFLPPVLERHDRRRFEIFVYSTGERRDAFTHRIETAAQHFHATRDPEELAGRVRADGIDILVDLAGHTMGPAHLGLALKPAPVGICWQGVLASTGLSAMDYFLGDAVMPLPGTEQCFSETVYRLERPFCCYRPLAQPPVAPSPCWGGRTFTFGCFNNPQKIGREVVMLWSAILHRAPQSRMLLKYANLENPAVHGHLREWFAECGIARERVIFEGASPPEEYLAAYSRVDLALDPFPYNGLTVTLDALWMGVPVITWTGRLAVQRAGASVLTAAGLEGLIATTAEEYLKLALEMKRVVPRLPALRSNVRAALRASPLMDEAGFVRSLEAAYRNMWTSWVSKQGYKKTAESRSVPPRL